MKEMAFFNFLFQFLLLNGEEEEDGGWGAAQGPPLLSCTRLLEAHFTLFFRLGAKSSYQRGLSDTVWPWAG